MTAAEFWESTAREIEARNERRQEWNDLQVKLWAIERRDFANANFRSRDHHPEAFTVEDFTGAKKPLSTVQEWNRRIRESAALKDRARSIVQSLNSRTEANGKQLSGDTVGLESSGVEAWLAKMKLETQRK